MLNNKQKYYKLYFGMIRSRKYKANAQERNLL